MLLVTAVPYMSDGTTLQSTKNEAKTPSQSVAKYEWGNSI